MNRSEELASLKTQVSEDLDKSTDPVALDYIMHNTERTDLKAYQMQL